MNTERWPLLLGLLELGENSKSASLRHTLHFCVAPGGIYFELSDPKRHVTFDK